MATTDKQQTLMPSLCLALTMAAAPGAYAQAESVVVEQRVEAVPAAPPQIVMQPGIALTSPQAVMRSNFQARLGHLLEQINLAAERGWLTPEQTASLKQWQANLVTSEANLRTADGGLLTGANSDQMERFVNSLALAVNMAINK